MKKNMFKSIGLALTLCMTIGTISLPVHASNTLEQYEKNWIEPEAWPTVDAPTSNLISEEEFEELGNLTTYSIPGTTFDDIAPDSWYAPYVEYMLNKGIMTGKGDNTFAPSEMICRAQFATTLYRMAGAKEVPYTDAFLDVGDGLFYTTPVLWAAQKDVNIIQGYDNGKFGPSDGITREQLATMLFRYANYLKLDTTARADLSDFPDASSVTEFAQEAIEWAVAKGIITGDKGNINPQGNSPRAVCAAMLQRFCKNILPEELPDIPMSATCSSFQIEQVNKNDSTFDVKVSGVTATHGVKKVIVALWNRSDQSDLRYYEAALQDDGSYHFTADVANHKFHFGSYQAAIYVLMNNGVRLYAGNGSGSVSGTHAQQMHQAAQHFSSGSHYLVLVDTKACKTAIFQRNQKAWDYLYYWPCSPGAPATPTIKGVFTTSSYKMKGFYSFGSYQYYATQFSGDYLFHSITYNTDGTVQDGRLGMQLSHGCVRLSLENAKWMYDYIPAGTTVYIY